MRKQVGFVAIPAPNVNQANTGRTYYLGDANATNENNLVTARIEIQPGSRIKKAGIRTRSSSPSVAGSVALCVYDFTSSTPQKAGEPLIIPLPGYGTNQAPQWHSIELDVDIDSLTGRIVSPAVSQHSGATVFYNTLLGNGNFVTTGFPESLAPNGNPGAMILQYYLEIEEPPPAGYRDIVVGNNPFYGDDMSIVRVFTGSSPKEGDQLRYSLVSRLGANVTVNADLTYSGTYPEGVEIPSSDDIYVSYWNDDTQEWVDYVVTVNFQQESEAPVNTELPIISGSGVVREQLTASTGVWTGEVDSFAYQWFVDNVDTGITSQTFTPVDSSYGKLISVSVTATNQFGSSTAASEEFGPIAGLAPSINSFVVSGSPYVGYTLTINLSSTGVPTPTITAKWFRSLGGVDEEIAGQTGNTYTLTEDDLGSQIYAQVELVNDVGSAVETSDKTSPVSEYRFSAKDISLRNGWYWAFSQMVSILKNLQQQLDNLKGG